MSIVSVVIPSRNELFVTQTIKDVLAKAGGEIEVIVIIDENWPEEKIDDKRVTYIHPDHPKGMRWGVNTGVAQAKGEYLMKCDAHCMFMPGFDLALVADMQPNWIVIPGRYSLDAANWCILENGKARRDYHYLCYPDAHKDHDLGMHGVEWQGMGHQHHDHKYDIDDTMSFQGSCWFMKKTWFTDFLGGMSEHGYGTFSQEPQEIGMKTWLGGGEIKVNKKVWYAHLHKGKQWGRMYHTNMREIVRGHNYSAWYWMNNSWEGQAHPISWFINKFWPVPTWPEAWHADWDKAFAEWKEVFPKEAEGIEIRS